MTIHLMWWKYQVCCHGHRIGLDSSIRTCSSCHIKNSFVQLQVFDLFLIRLQHLNEDSINCSGTIIKSNCVGRFKPLRIFFLLNNRWCICNMKSFESVNCVHDNPHTCKHILVGQTILHQYVVWWPACKVTQCTTKMSRTQDGTIVNWWVNIIATSSPLLLISVVCHSCGFNSGSKPTLQPPEWFICHLICAPKIRRAKACINGWHIMSNMCPCGSSFSTPFSSYLNASKNRQRQPQQPLQQRLVQRKGLHWQWTWTGWFIGAVYTLIKWRTIYLNARWYDVLMIAPRAYLPKKSLPLELAETGSHPSWSSL